MKRRGHACLAIVLIGIVSAPLILHLDYLLYPRGGEATDLTITHWPAVVFNVRSLRQDGQIPLWRTTIASGGPWAANPQSWLTYPPAWFFFLLPINVTFNLLLLAHLALAALATYAFGRRALALGTVGAALAGLAFALAPWLSGQLSAGHVNVILALAWLPVALLGTQRATTTGQVGGALLAGVAWAAALLNHLQMAAFIAAVTVAWGLLVTVGGKAPVRQKRQLGLLILVPAVALALGAVLLVPLAEALPYLNRTALSLDETGALSLPWAHLLTTVIPTYGGEPEQVIYVGLPVALLAAVGLVTKRDRSTWFLAFTALLAALFALGTHGPLLPLLLVPGLSWLRVPPRAWLLVAFSLALLAGRGLDVLAGPQLGRTDRRKVTLVGLVALVVELLLAGGLLFLYQPAPPAVWVMAGVTVLAVAALMLRTRSLLGPGAWTLVLLILTAADLGLVRTAWTEMRAPADAFAWGRETADYLAEQPGMFRSYSPSYSVPQHTAVQHALSLADGIDPFQLAHYADFLATAGGYEESGYSPSLPPSLSDASARPDADRLGLLNVGYVVADWPVEAEGLVLRERLETTYIYQNERVLPHAFIVTNGGMWSGDGLTLDPVVDAKPARIAMYTPNRIVVEANLEAPGLLVLSEVWYPGWRAMTDGRTVPIERVEGTLRGVALDRGAHIVELRYAPWTAWTGLALSGGAALALIGYVACRAWRRS